MENEKMSRSEFQSKCCDAYIAGYTASYGVMLAEQMKRQDPNMAPMPAIKWEDVWTEAHDAGCCAEEAFATWFLESSNIWDGNE